MRWMLAAMLVLGVGCVTLNPGELPLNSSGRDFPETFLGGWDGHSLRLFDDTTLEPGKSTYQDVVTALANLSSTHYAALVIDPAKLAPAMAATHGLFCATVACVAVIQRKAGSEVIGQWGRAIAIFELNGFGPQPIGSVWIQEHAIRPPGPRKWPLLCRNKTDQPRYVHEDGGAIFPARRVEGADFAVFGPQEIPAQYQNNGFQAPATNTCDDDVARLQSRPKPAVPVIKADPALLLKHP